jgi:hypothetical protein
LCACHCHSLHLCLAAHSLSEATTEAAQGMEYKLHVAA